MKPKNGAEAGHVSISTLMMTAIYESGEDLLLTNQVGKESRKWLQEQKAWKWEG
jgi:hypothetical protein